MIHLALALCLVSWFPAPDTAADIRALLDAQVAAWNRGDLPGFLAPYRHSEDLTFFSGGNVIKGFAAIQQRYEKRYGTSPETMGRLAFEDLEIFPLAPDAVMVRGRYRLQMKDGRPTGLFTLLLKRAGRRWEIVHDHTSAE
jgi:beta-aspartyl-peptidase (threonine type)